MESEDEAEVEQKGPLRKRVWDDDFVLKRQFSALIAAFDPRPGTKQFCFGFLKLLLFLLT